MPPFATGAAATTDFEVATAEAVAAESAALAADLSFIVNAVGSPN